MEMLSTLASKRLSIMFANLQGSIFQEYNNLRQTSQTETLVYINNRIWLNYSSVFYVTKTYFVAQISLVVKKSLCCGYSRTILLLHEVKNVDNFPSNILCFFVSKWLP